MKSRKSQSFHCRVRAPAAFVISVALLAAAPARSADLGGNCCADLEERIAELEATTGRKGNRRVNLTITGFVAGQLGFQPVYVVIDPTSFALENNALRWIGADITNILNGTLNGSVASAPFAPAGQMNLGALPPDAVSSDSGTGGVPLAQTGVWGAGLGGRAKVDGDDLSETEDTFGGGIGGANFRLAPNFVAGAFAGGATNRLETERGKRIDTDYVLGGVYGRAVSGQVFLDASLTGGHSDSSSDRGIRIGTPGGVTFETARGNYDGTFLLPALALGAYLPLGNGAVLLPAAQVRYNWQHFDGYEESGSPVNLKVGDRELQSVEERIELGIQKSIGMQSGGSLTLHASLGGVFYQRTGDRDVEVSLFGTPASFDPDAPDSEAGIFGRAGFNADLAAGVSFFGDGEYQWFDDVEAASGTAGIKAKF